MDKTEFYQELYVNKNYDKLICYYSTQENACEEEKLAKILMLSGDYAAATKLYKKLNVPFLEGYCELLLGNLSRAKVLWLGISDNNSMIAWGKSLLGILEGHITIYPTFFQLRNYLEIDLSNFIIAQRFDYIQNVANSLWLLIQLNGECYKYFGRVLFNHGSTVDALSFLEKAKETCYGDPETHFLLAKCFMELHQKENAKKAIVTCLDVAPGYYPAEVFFD